MAKTKATKARKTTKTGKKVAAASRKKSAKRPAPKKKAAPKRQAKTPKRVARSTKKSAAKKTKKAVTKAKKSVAKRPAAKPAAKAPKKPKVAAKQPAAAKQAAPPKTEKPKTAKRAKRIQPPEPVGPVFVQWGSERIELVDDSRRIPKTKLTKKELREFKTLLQTKREELVGDMTHLSSSALGGGSGNSGGLSNVPFHMADVGSDNWEQEFTLGLIENERTLVREVDQALERIADRTYGVCLATHRPIDKARLRAKPWAKYCIEYARLKELGRVP